MLKFYIYELKLTVMQEDWTDKVAPGALKPTVTVLDSVIVNDLSDNLCIGGYGKDDKYYQFDSHEAYYAADYFSQKFDAHGLFTEYYTVEIPTKDLEKYKAK